MDTGIRRLGIFCFYDSEGIVDSYIEYLLNELGKNLTKLVIVVNGFVNENGKKVFAKYSQNILVRENKGFDIGAFKDGFIHFVGKKGIVEWDEIVFCNDTFYGPFIPFNNIFAKMDQEETDFWGINLVEDGMLTHIQSFFLVFRNEEIIEDLFDYLNNQTMSMLLMTDNIADIYAAYELGLFRFLVQRGYKFSTYTNTQDYDIYQSPDMCIKKFGLPLLKKKCFSKLFFHESVIRKAISYIKENFVYDIMNIQQNVVRQYEINPKIFLGIDGSLENIYEHVQKRQRLIDEKKIIDFINENVDIYIYGTGVYARKIWYLFHDSMAYFRGFIVSDNQKINEILVYGKPVYHYSDVGSNCAIIIGCDIVHTKEILSNLKHSGKICVLWEELGEIVSE